MGAAAVGMLSELIAARQAGEHVDEAGPPPKLLRGELVERESRQAPSIPLSNTSLTGIGRRRALPSTFPESCRCGLDAARRRSYCALTGNVFEMVIAQSPNRR